MQTVLKLFAVIGPDITPAWHILHTYGIQEVGN